MANRITNHNERSSKNSKETFGTKHNDRNIAYIGNEHYDIDKMQDNKYVLFHADMNFLRDENNKSINNKIEYNQQMVDRGYYNYNNHEQVCYTTLFQEHLDVRNKKYIDNRKKDQVWSIEDYRFKKQSCAEESLLYIGDKDHQPENISNDEFMQMVDEYVMAIENKYPNVKFLDAHLHCDEKAGAINKNRDAFLDEYSTNQIQGARHVHLRRIYVANDKEGLLHISQTKALEEMGIKSPTQSMSNEDFEEYVEQVIKDHPKVFGNLEGEDLKKAVDKQIKGNKGRYNNPKMTFTNDCRNIWLDICEEHHIDVIREAQDPQMNGRSLKDYMNAKKEEKSQMLNSNINVQEKELYTLRTKNKQLQGQLNEQQSIIDIQNKEITNKDNQIMQQDKIITTQQETIDNQQHEIQTNKQNINSVKEELKETQSLLEYVKSILRRITHMKDKVIPNQLNNPYIKDIKHYTSEANVRVTHAQDKNDIYEANNCMTKAEGLAGVNPNDIQDDYEIDL